MCYSAAVRSVQEEYWDEIGIRLNYAEAEEIFRQRQTDRKIRIPRSFEAYFDQPRNTEERRIKELIEEHRSRSETALQMDLFKQAKRLADAQRSLQSRQTKKAMEDVRIASAKMDANRQRLARLRAPDIDIEDCRIFPFWYAPIVVNRGGNNTLTLARYHLRQQNAPASVDRMYPGLYNARRDNLSRFWRNEFGHTHAVLLVTSFFENVERDGRNVVLHFNPRPAQTMYVACLYSEWTSPTEGRMRTFAAVTDEPPPEIAAAGHDRCIVNLQPANVARWLTPEGRSDAELQSILDEKQKPYYEHAIAA